jgi:hypothetical protein
MEIQKLLVFLFPILIGALGITFNEAIKEIIKRYFSSLTKTEINIFFVVLLLITAAAASQFGNVIGDKIETATVIPTPIINEKSDAEVYVEAGEKVIEIGEKIIKSKHAKDSIRATNRETLWVYQIGLAKRDIDELWSSYEKLKSIPNIYIFKESRRKYFLIKDDGYSESRLRDSLETENLMLAKIGIENRLSVINLMSLCNRRQKIVEDAGVKNKKMSCGLRCYICD